MKIKVASYNMRKGIGTDRRRDPQRILDVLTEIDADVVALQEADRRFGTRAAVVTQHHLAEHGGWKAVGFGARALSLGWHGNALLVRRSAEVVACEMLQLPTLEPRGAVLADLTIRGEIVRVVGMHLDLSGLWRRRQAHAIIAHLSDGRRVVARSDDPQIAPNAAQPPIEAIASPPRRCPRNAAAARYSARLIPAWVANSPISTNSGITDSE